MIHLAYAYLAVGALTGLAALIANRNERMPALTFFIAMLVMVLFWPLCIVAGVVMQQRKKRC